MSVTLKARAGSSLRAQLRLWQPDHSTLVDTTPYTARIQMRATQPPEKIIVSANEYTGTLPAPPSTMFTRLEPGKWELFLGKTLTTKLPPTVVFEIKLINNDNDEDSINLCTGILRVEPAEVLEVLE